MLQTEAPAACAETEPETSSRTGRRCGEQRQAWQTGQNWIYFRRKPFSISGENPFLPGDRDTTVPRRANQDLAQTIGMVALDTARWHWSKSDQVTCYVRHGVGRGTSNDVNLQSTEFDPCR
jgi:hypothetical protein